MRKYEAFVSLHIQDLKVHLEGAVEREVEDSLSQEVLECLKKWQKRNELFIDVSVEAIQLQSSEVDEIPKKI